MGSCVLLDGILHHRSLLEIFKVVLREILELTNQAIRQVMMLACSRLGFDLFTLYFGCPSKRLPKVPLCLCPFVGSLNALCWKLHRLAPCFFL